MLEKPDLPEAAIVACLQAEYGLAVTQLSFLPLGADLRTAVYRAGSADGAPYFVKLRSGAFDPASVELPKFLCDQGIAHIMAPVAVGTGALWTHVRDFTLVLYPFVAGRDGYAVALSERQWAELGQAFRRIHTVDLPPSLRRRIRREGYPSRGREDVRAFLARMGELVPADAVAAETIAFLQAKQGEILELVDRAEHLAAELQRRPREFVLCHADLHAGNLLIEPSGSFTIVDWDDPILAPRERDLMVAGGGLMGGWRTPPEEERLFYTGYGPAPADRTALAYYRCERIVQDIAAYCAQLLESGEGGEDRAQSLRYLQSNFLPGGTIELAYATDTTR